MQILGKKVGIWGFGRVGKSVATYAAPHAAHIFICDLEPVISLPPTLSHASFIPHSQLSDFFQLCDTIVPSPGIDVRPYYKEIGHKLVCELDLFQQSWKNEIIAITGSVGKTSITTLLSSLFSALSTPIALGGNIGHAALNLVAEYPSHPPALLEVSSFQLEFCRTFSPDFAIISNIYANHLDRHESMELYMAAKLRMIANQQSHQQILIPVSLWPRVSSLRNFDVSKVALFSLEKPKDQEKGITYYWLEQEYLYRNNLMVSDIRSLMHVTFRENALIIAATLDKKNLLPSLFDSLSARLTLPAHRMELIPTHKKLLIYNDSKATTMASTLAALAQLPPHPIHLLIGGLSKGANRQELMRQLPPHIKHVYCFGKEAEKLSHYSTAAFHPASAHAMLEEAIDAVITNAQPEEIILFSPAGSSYDLFKNYEERGNFFKQYITQKLL